MTVYWEDIELGQTLDLGAHTFTEEEIIAFARQFDPQPFHVDKAAAEASPYGGLIASGWHTAAVWMKRMIATREKLTREGAAMTGGISPGFRDLRWLKPVRPGDTIRYSTMPTEKVTLKSRPELGLLRSRNEGVNQHGETVFRFTGQALVPRRGG
jgi:acyl dehydratase